MCLPSLFSTVYLRCWNEMQHMKVSATVQTTWIFNDVTTETLYDWLYCRVAAVQCMLDLYQLSSPFYVLLCNGFEVKKKKSCSLLIPGSVQAHSSLTVWYWLVWPASCFFSLPAVTVTDDSVRDITDCLDAGRDEMWEKSLPNKQVTFLVYREGDQLNFFRVVDRGDGTLTPVSESLRSVQRREITCQEEQPHPHCSLVPFFRWKQMFQNTVFMCHVVLLKKICISIYWQT